MTAIDRIIHGRLLSPTSFEENVYFDADRPYTVSIKTFPEEDVTIPHYAPTIEILVGRQIRGDIYIEKRRFSVHGDCVYVVPPHSVHSMRLTAMNSQTVLYVVKLSLEHLGEYLNLDGFLRRTGTEIRRFPLSYANIADFYAAVEKLIADDGDLFARMADILSLWRLLCEGCRAEAPPLSRTPSLAMLLDWSADHYGEHISVEQAAALMGYSRYYFCRWFRAASGVTYLEYLTQLRMRKAAEHLARGYSVAEVGRRCGYENTSHFIRLFTRHYHTTPGAFARSSAAQTER